eukprot:3515740-Rhodomonas_salina.1
MLPSAKASRKAHSGTEWNTSTFWASIARCSSGRTESRIAWLQQNHCQGKGRTTRRDAGGVIYLHGKKW